MMNTNSPSKDRKNVQYQSPGKLLITMQAAGYIRVTTAVFNSKDNCTPGINDLFTVDRIQQSLKSAVRVRDLEFIAVYRKPSVKGIYRECADRINRGSTRISPETIGDLNTTPISMDLLPP